MTTIISDKATRKNAVPFRGLWYSNLNIGGVGVSLDDGQADGDLRPFSLGSAAQVRIATPAKGELIEARLTAQFTVPNTAGTTLSIYIGRFAADGVTVTSLSNIEIARQHEILTGLTSPFTYGAGEEVIIDGLNLMSMIPRKGTADFNEDAFIIGLDLTLAGSSLQWYLSKFNVDCSTQIAEVRK